MEKVKEVNKKDSNVFKQRRKISLKQADHKQETQQRKVTRSDLSYLPEWFEEDRKQFYESLESAKKDERTIEEKKKEIAEILASFRKQV